MSEKRHKKPAVQLTVEQVAELAAARKKAEDERKAEQERIMLYGKMLPKLSDNQIRGELRRIRRAEGRPDPETRRPGFHAGLTIAFATVLETVFKNTQTPTNPMGTLSHYLNPAKSARSQS